VNIADLTSSAGEWLSGDGPMSEVVISSRIRLARNLTGYPFLTRCTAQQRAQIERYLRHQVLQAGIAEQLFYVDIEDIDSLQRQILVERHLISRQHAEQQGSRGVALSPSETVAVMINEEDHLRIQVLRSGLQLQRCYEQIDRIDDLLEQHLDYAFSPRFGYLTACPTNVGTGIRVSVMMHLPALKLTGEIEKVIRAARDMHLAIRGLFGEGTEAIGDFFQISNQTTLGVTEQEVVENFSRRIVPRIVEYELKARQLLTHQESVLLDDKISRSLGLLQNARMLSSEETMYLLSHIRMGVHLGRVRNVELKTINELFLQTQPAHLQVLHGQLATTAEQRKMRAKVVRSRLGDASMN